MNRVGNPAAAESAPPRLDARGRYRVRGRISFGVVGFYLFLLLLIGVFLRPPGTALWVGSLLAGLVLLFLARYLSTGYTLDCPRTRVAAIPSWNGGTYSTTRLAFQSATHRSPCASNAAA